MQNACSLSQIFSSGLCLDEWLSRYQSFVVGIIALTIAAIQVWIAYQNMAIQKEQQRSRKMQENTQKALATLAAIRFLRSAVALNDFVISRGLNETQRVTSTGVEFSWRPHILANLEYFPPADASDLEENASLAFPKRAADIVELGRACSDVADLVNARKSMGDLDMNALEFGPLTGEQSDLLTKVNDALNRLFNGVKKCADLLPENRAAANQ